MTFCGIDIGTTNTKAVLVSAEGRLLDAVAFTPGASRHVETTSGMYERFSECLDYFKSRGHFFGQHIVCSVTAQGGTFLMLDKQLKPASGVHSWTALASQEVVTELQRDVDPLWFYRTTGWNLNAWLPAVKLKEFTSRGLMPPDAAFIVSIPDFIFSCLSGKITTDITSAQMLGLVDFRNKTWSDRITDSVGLDVDILPAIGSGIEVLAERLPSPWGRLTFVTGSHDQYAAMNAAGLRKDKDLMLACGTAWVINVRTEAPVYDYRDFLIHPGSDLMEGCYGSIITLGSVGGEFERLLKQIGITFEQLEEIEKKFSKSDLPDGPLYFDCACDAAKTCGSPEIAVRRCMEWGAARVAYALAQFSFTKRAEKIIMSGGAARSTFWPHVVAELCNIKVEVVDFPELTAYGAALYARHPFLTDAVLASPLPCRTKTYNPLRNSRYRQWFEEYQKKAFSDWLCSGKVERAV